MSWESEARALTSGRDASLAVRASGVVLMAYAKKSENGEGYDVLYRSSEDQGDSFSEPRRLNPEPGSARSHGETRPHLALGPRSEIYVSWQGANGLELAASRDFGRSFPLAEGLRADTQSGFYAMHAAPDGRVHLVWLDRRDRETDAPGTAALYLATSDDRGASFAPAVRVAGSVCPCCSPALGSGPGGELVVAWRHLFSGARDLAVSRSTDGGRSWSDPLRVAADGWEIEGCPHSGPSVTLEGGQITVAWYTGAGDSATLRVARSPDGGRSFTTASSIQGDTLDSNHPALLDAPGSGPGLVAFQGRPGSQDGWAPPRVFVTLSDGSSAPVGLDPREGSSAYPRLYAGLAGRVYALWTESGADGAEVVLQRGRLRSGP